MKSLFTNRWLGMACRLLLGLVFLYAAIPKIEQPPDFAKEIAPYGILPPRLVNVMAIYLPWLELFTGLALLSGIAARAASVTAAGLLLMFISAILVRFARGETSFECGCAGGGHSIADTVPLLSPALKAFIGSSEAWVTLLRDIFLLLLAVVGAVASGRRSVARPEGV